MSMNSSILIGILIPFIGTVLGAALVFFMRSSIGQKTEKFLLGFAAGVMIAASVWSLIIPGIDMSIERGGIGWLPAAAGFLSGIAFLLLLDTFVPHLHLDSDRPEGVKSGFGKNTMLFLAVTLHNIPEGMAVGIVFAGMIADDTIINISSAFALSLGIAIQNFPEGAIISLPMSKHSNNKFKPFLYGAASGAVEPLAAFVTVMISGLMIPIMPFLMAFAAGAMFYVVVEELIPESQSGKHSNIGTIGAALGFALMMILDVSLG